MPRKLFDAVVLREAVLSELHELATPCQPRLLIVTDDMLDFSTGYLGLSRFVEAIADYWVPPSITLAHRDRPLHSVTIGGKSYVVEGRRPNDGDVRGFVFDGSNIDVSIEHFDQIWLFGFSDRPLGDGEVRKIAEFMEAGGGVFATGDHGTIGSGMGARLPRIRHMRDWASIPMGTEGNAKARDRIDTIVNPGENGLYESIDQGDDVPQRIYPNNRVLFLAGGDWVTSIHPVLQLPGAGLHTKDIYRFGNEVDVLPDHPHESVCLEVSTTVNSSALASDYRIDGFSLREFPPSFLGDRILGSEIVAYAVSAGRSLSLGGDAYKPPVNPRMFGIISAFDGHPAFSLDALRPGRVLCDSTWHHFVNLNIDGGDTGRSGLGTGSGPSWTPSAAGEKVFAYYRNAITWLQPAARRRCPIFIVGVLLRLNAELVEELVGVESLEDPRRLAAIGAQAVRLVEAEQGTGTAAEMIRSVLRIEPETRALADEPEADLFWADPQMSPPAVAYVFGRLLSHTVSMLPAVDAEAIHECACRHEAAEAAAARVVAEAAREAVVQQIERDEARLKRLTVLRSGTGAVPAEGGYGCPRPR